MAQKSAVFAPPRRNYAPGYQLKLNRCRGYRLAVFSVYAILITAHSAFGVTTNTSCNAGYYLTDDGQCDKCPVGYYCADNVKNACPAGTYSTGGATECAVCPDNTWSDAGAVECNVCPGGENGYGNSGDAANHAGIVSCVAKCNAGEYVPTVGDACTKITGDVPYYTYAHTVAYGDVSGENYKRCPTPGHHAEACWNVYHTSIDTCACSGILSRHEYNAARKVCNTGGSVCLAMQTTHGIVRNPCYYTSGDDGNAIYDNNNRFGCVGGSRLISCDAGFWAPVRRYDDAGIFLGCQPVDTGYYSPDGDLDRYPCPDGTMTAGYGDNAAGIADCVPYKKLHIGDVVLQLSGRKYSTPALAVEAPDGNRYYGFMNLGAKSGVLNTQLATGRYSIINPLDQFERGQFPGTRYASAFDVIIVP